VYPYEYTIIFDCKFINRLREELKKEVLIRVEWPVNENVLVDKHLKTFITFMFT